MLKNFISEVVLSHSQSSGYQYDVAFEAVVPDIEIRKKIMSTEAELTKFASYQQYLKDDLNLTSYFVIDNYAVFLRAVKAKDNRQYCESTLRIASFTDQDEPLELDFEDGEISHFLRNDVFNVFNDRKFFMLYQQCVLKSALSESFKLMIIVNNPTLGFDEKLISYTFMQVVPCTLVKHFNYFCFVKEPIYSKHKIGIYYCQSEQEKTQIIRTADITKTFVFDFAGSNPEYECRIPSQPYAHRVINYIFQTTRDADEYNKIKYRIEEIMKTDERFRSDPNNQIWYNKLAFELLRRYYKGYENRIEMTKEEYKNIITLNTKNI